MTLSSAVTYDSQRVTQQMLPLSSCYAYQSSNLVIVCREKYNRTDTDRHFCKCFFTFFYKIVIENEKHASRHENFINFQTNFEDETRSKVPPKLGSPTGPDFGYRHLVSSWSDSILSDYTNNRTKSRYGRTNNYQYSSIIVFYF